MKKILSLVLLLALFCLALASCRKTEKPSVSSVSANVGYLGGTTGLGMAKLISDSRAASDSALIFKPYDKPAEIMAAVSSGAIDFACLPTNAFPNFYKSMNGSIQLAAINTLGVLYIATNGMTVENLSDLAGKTVYVPEAAPKLVLQYLLQLYEIEGVTLDMEYDLDTLPPALASGRVKIALLPEPKLTVASNLAKQNSSTVTVALDLTELWSEKSDYPLVQGALVVNTEFAEKNPKIVNDFLSLYENSIQFMAKASNLDAAAQYAVDAGILPNVAVAKSAIPRSNLTFMSGSDMKVAASGFFTALGSAAPSGNWTYEKK